jgi:hypothetical protein
MNRKKRQKKEILIDGAVSKNLDLIIIQEADGASNFRR